MIQNKNIFEDLISILPLNEEKIQYILTFETLRNIKYNYETIEQQRKERKDLNELKQLKDIQKKEEQKEGQENEQEEEETEMEKNKKENIYSIRDFRIHSQLFAGMLNSLQEMNDPNLINLLENGLPPIFNDISLTGPVENYAVLRGFRNGVNHTQLFICEEGVDPVPLKIPPGVTLGGYTRNVSQWDIVFYSRAQPIYHFKNYTLFMSRIRHLLAMIYELFKLGL